jgi:hypothetical protein
MSLPRAFALAFALLVCPSLMAAAFAGCDGCGPSPGVALAARPVSGPVFAAVPCGMPCVVPHRRALPALSPMEPVAVAPDPIAVDHWDTNGFGACRYPGDYFGACGGFAGCGRGPCVGPAPCVACRPPMARRAGPSLYIVNQGPEYSGPGFFIPFKTYSPTTGLAAPRQFPYISAGHIYHPPLAVRG